MRIGLVCQHYEPTRGGLERYTWNLSGELQRHGHEVHVFCNQGEAIPNITLHHVPMFPFSSPGKNLSFAISASKCIAGKGLDVVQSMERIWTQDIFRASDGIKPIQMQEKYPNRLVRHFKSMGPRRKILSLLERRIFENGGARLILTNSNLVKHQILKHYRISEEKITVIYNSVDARRFNPSGRATCRRAVRDAYGIDRNDKLLLFSGNDFQRKGLLTVLEALVLLKKENIKLIVAGAEKAGRYRKFAEHNGIADAVFFIGYHPKPEDLYRSADLFVLPTRYDAFANVCLEAMACGTPVITTLNNGSAELICDGIEGYVLRTMEAEELSVRIREVFNSNSGMMGDRAVRKASAFTVGRYIDSILSLYQKIL